MRPLPDEALVVPHEQVRLDLLHRVERDADDDQERSCRRSTNGSVEPIQEHVGQHRDRARNDARPAA